MPGVDALAFRPPLVFAPIKAAFQSYRLYRAARFSWHFLRDPIFRRDHLLLWRRPAGLFQHRSITRPNRYPAVFEFLRDRLGSVPAPRVLSFGCATGEEVFSLRHYLPQAAIKGIDINPANLRACEARRRAEGARGNVCFAQGASALAEPVESYDAVLCMAVFVRWSLRNRPDVATSLPHLRFSDYERTTTELAARVKPDGYLVIRHAMFRFADTAAATDFECVLTLPVRGESFPRFGADNRRLPEATFEQVIFQKRASGRP
ncbi:MAG TPA: class I SAM-dependent methyltransferase [Opitutaceae bacterium]|nr:class I SAM-dependent methyltransferase [Opitutaceae bacterium]